MTVRTFSAILKQFEEDIASLDALKAMIRKFVSAVLANDPGTATETLALLKKSSPNGCIATDNLEYVLVHLCRIDLSLSVFQMVVQIAFSHRDQVTRGFAILLLLEFLRDAERVEISTILGQLGSVVVPFFSIDIPLGKKADSFALTWLQSIRYLIDYNKDKLEEWRRLAGSELETMLSSRSATERYIHHPSPDLRLASMLVWQAVWKCDEQFAAECERLSFEDEDLRIRTNAIFCLACCYEKTDDARIGHLMASAIVNKEFDASFRETAYRGLYLLRGVPVLDWPNAPHDRFPEDVDWDFVRGFLIS